MSVTSPYSFIKRGNLFIVPVGPSLNEVPYPTYTITKPKDFSILVRGELEEPEFQLDRARMPPSLFQDVRDDLLKFSPVPVSRSAFRRSQHAYVGVIDSKGTPYYFALDSHGISVREVPTNDDRVWKTFDLLADEERAMAITQRRTNAADEMHQVERELSEPLLVVMSKSFRKADGDGPAGSVHPELRGHERKVIGHTRSGNPVKAGHWVDHSHRALKVGHDVAFHQSAGSIRVNHREDALTASARAHATTASAHNHGGRGDYQDSKRALNPKGWHPENHHNAAEAHEEAAVHHEVAAHHGSSINMHTTTDDHKRAAAGHHQKADEHRLKAKIAEHLHAGNVTQAHDAAKELHASPGGNAAEKKTILDHVERKTSKIPHNEAVARDADGSDRHDVAAKIRRMRKAGEEAPLLFIKSDTDGVAKGRFPVPHGGSWLWNLITGKKKTHPREAHQPRTARAPKAAKEPKPPKAKKTPKEKKPHELKFRTSTSGNQHHATAPHGSYKIDSGKSGLRHTLSYQQHLHTRVTLGSFKTAHEAAAHAHIHHADAQATTKSLREMCDLSKAGHTGTMVSLHIPREIAEQIALPGGEPADSLHVTLAYLGKDLTEAQKLCVAVAVRRFAQQAWPIKMLLGGVGRFSASHTSEGNDVVYLSVDSPDITRLRPKLLEELAAEGIEPSNAHGFVPHVTLSYVPTTARTPIKRFPPLAVEFSTVSLTIADSQMLFPFTRTSFVIDVAKALPKKPKEEKAKKTKSSGASKKQTGAGGKTRYTYPGEKKGGGASKPGKPGTQPLVVIEHDDSKNADPQEFANQLGVSVRTLQRAAKRLGREGFSKFMRARLKRFSTKHGIDSDYWGTMFEALRVMIPYDQDSEAQASRRDRDK